MSPGPAGHRREAKTYPTPEISDDRRDRHTIGVVHVRQSPLYGGSIGGSLCSDHLGLNLAQVQSRLQARFLSRPKVA